MAISSKADEKQIDSTTNGFGSWYSVPKDSVVKMVFLCELFGDDAVTQYLECSVGSGKGKDFITIPSLMNDKKQQADNDPCKIIGLEAKTKWIAPVIVFDAETKEWSEPMYFRFGKSVFDALREVNELVKEEVASGRTTLAFKGAVLRITRNDQTKNGFTQYSVNFAGQHWSELKNVQPLPENPLDMDRGILGFEYTNDDDVRSKLITKLQSKGHLKHDGKTILELLKEHNLLSEELDDDDYEMVS